MNMMHKTGILPVTLSFSRWAAHRENTRTLSVLYVDECPMLLDVVCRYLEKDGEMMVDLSLSVEDAIRKMKYITYDVVVTDYNFEDGSGNSLLAFLRNHGNQVPFVYFVLARSPEIEEEAKKLGRVSFVEKTHKGPSSAIEDLYREIHAAMKSEQPTVSPARQRTPD